MTAPTEDADVETASEGYAKRFASPVGVWMLDVQRDTTLDLLADAPDASVLDVGGGHGQIAPALSAKGHQVSVLASTADAVSLSLRPAIDSGRVALLTGDLRNPPGERSFDVVISYRLLAHARDLSGLIAGFTRVAKRSVIVDYATSRSFNAAADLLFAAKKRVEANTRPFLVMRDADVEALFRQHGFALHARRPQFFWPMALHRALKAPVLSRTLEAVAAAVGLRRILGSPVIARFDRV